MNPLKNFFHSLRRYKAATLLNLFGLTVAFASFIVIMTQVRYDLTFDRHYRHTDRIYRLENKVMSQDGAYFVSMNRPLANKIFELSPEIETMGLINSWQTHMVYDLEKGEISRQGPFFDCLIEPGVLNALEFEYLQGNPDRIMEPNTVMLSQEVATALYGQENPVGRSIVYGSDTGAPREIIAVYKSFPKNSSVKDHTIARFIGNRDVDSPYDWSYAYFIRLKPGADPVKLQRSMAEVYKELFGADRADADFFRLNPVSEIHFSQDVRFDQVEKGSRSTVYSLIAIAILILVIAMINFINFATSLVPVRIRSINTQKVFGETNGIIRRSLIFESVGISLIAFAASLFVVQLFSMTSWASLISIPIGIGSDWQILAGTAVAALLTGLLAGIYPAFYSTSFPPALVLKGSFGLTSRGIALRTGLILLQFGISTVLIIVAISISLQNRYMQRFDMGFDRENILTAMLSEHAAGQRNTLASLLKSNPAVTDITFTYGPLVGKGMAQKRNEYKGKSIIYERYPVAWNFLSFMGLKMTEGRDFTESDEQKESPSYIFNQTAQRQDSITIGDKMGNADIVGIVRDFNFQPLHFNISPLGIYMPGSNDWALQHMLVKIRTSDISGTIDYIHKTIQEFDPDGKSDVTFLDDAIGQLYQKEQNLSRLVLLFSLLSVLIAVVGVFGLVLFETQYRRKEIGLRKMHGATIGEILWMFNRGYVRLVLICFVVGTPLAYWIVGRWLENFAYQVPFSAWACLAALALVLGVTVATISLQCYKTASENPVKSIKTE